MNKTNDSRRSTFAQIMHALLWFLVVMAIASGLAVLLPGPLYRLGALGLGGAFDSIRYGAYGGIATIVLGVLMLLASVFARRGIRVYVVTIFAVVIGIVAWGVPYSWMMKAESLPVIHDITTDTTNPPQFRPDVIALRAAAHATNSTKYGGAKVAALQEKAYPSIKPMLFTLSAQKVFRAALRTANAMGWKLDSENPHTGIIQASSTTFWFGFIDDVVIRVKSRPDGSRLDIRSESRIGKSDIGRNAERIRKFRARLYKNLGLPAPKS